MPASMTAFSRQESQGDWGTLTVELRSVNHRYLDVSLRLPEELRSLEPKLRERLSARVARGKLDCQVRYQPPEAGSGELQINRELATRIAQASREIDGLLYDPAPVSSLEVLRWPGVLATAEADAGCVREAALGAVEAALDELIAMRRREGERIRELVAGRCEEVAELVGQVRDIMPEVRQRWRERLLARLEEVRAELDPARLEQEIAIFAQKIDISEELDRLQAHLEEVRQVITEDKPVGRRLDFLMQELNREANTLGSKSADARTSRAAVDLKVLIEQMREQIQNVE